MNDIRVAVFGGGTWGSTLAWLLRARRGAQVRLWEFDPEVAARLRQTRSPAKLPHLSLPAEILVTHDLGEAADGARHWVVVVPSHGVRAWAQNLAPRFAASPPESITVCTKGIDAETGRTMTQLAAGALGDGAADRLVALSGPSHAEEVSREMPTTVVAAGEDAGRAETVQEIFNAPRFRVYTGTDVLGVELGAALKNVIAIASGICDGMGFGDNSRAALITRGLAEITRLGVRMGAQARTFAGLTGMGDLIVTAGSRHSRNRNFGEYLATGLTPEEARAKVGMEVEGVYAARAARELAVRYETDMPISSEVYAILYEDKAPEQAVQDLLSRDPKPEVYG